MKQIRVIEKIVTPYQAKYWKATVAAVDEAVAASPEFAPPCVGYKFAALYLGGHPDAAFAYGETIMKSADSSRAVLGGLTGNLLIPATSRTQPI